MKEKERDIPFLLRAHVGVFEIREEVIFHRRPVLLLHAFTCIWHFASSFFLYLVVKILIVHWYNTF